jgi:hypothetical protein
MFQSIELNNIIQILSNGCFLLLTPRWRLITTLRSAQKSGRFQ